MPPAIRFALASLALNAVGFGLIVPVVPKLVMELAATSIDGATAIGGWLAFTFAAFQFVFSPIMGNLSDRFGRRPVLLGSVTGFAIDFLAMALAPTLTWVFVARAISGIFGASNAPAQSLIADLTAPEERSRYFGMVGAAFAIGFVVGPAIGGLLGEFGHRVPLYVAGGLTGANAIYGYFNLPETLKPENRRPFEWRRATPGGALRNIRKLPGIGPLALVYLLWQIATLIYPMIWPYWAIGLFGWSEGVVGASLAGVGITLAIVQIMVLPRLVARYGERKTALIGMIGAGAAMFAFVGVTHSWMVVALLPLMAMQALVHANLTSMMTRRATASTQGEVQGFASAVMAIGSLVAPLIFNPLLAWFTSPAAPFVFHGAPFLVAGLFAALCIPVMLRLPPAPIPEPSRQS
jgi:DHA1 family tetracycline resistance protein-like MFS transporter